MENTIKVYKSLQTENELTPLILINTQRLPLSKRLAFGVGHVFNDICAALWFTYSLIFLQLVVEIGPTQAGGFLLLGKFIIKCLWFYIVLIYKSLHLVLFSLPWYKLFVCHSVDNCLWSGSCTKDVDWYCVLVSWWACLGGLVIPLEIFRRWLNLVFLSIVIN